MVTALLSAGASVSSVDGRTWIDLRLAYRKAMSHAETTSEDTALDAEDEVRKKCSSGQWLDAMEKARLMVTKLKELKQLHQSTV